MKLASIVLALTFTLAVALAAPREARAQVNTEPLRKRIKNAGYSLLIEGAITGDTGNTQGIQAGGGLGAGLAHAPHLAFVYGRADYSRFNGVTQMEKTFAHARYVFELRAWLWDELFVQAQSDQFQRLKMRNLVGFGPRARLLHRDTFDVFVGTAFIVERDVIDVTPGGTDRRDSILARWGSYLTAHWDIDTRAALATTMYVQPALRDLSNARLLSETLLAFKVTKLLAASTSATVRYDSAPPTAAKTTDAEIKSTLSLTF